MMNTRCDWELFRSELPKIPREINLLRILLQKIYDSNNVVAMKAINAFLKVATDGNLLCKELIRVRFDLIEYLSVYCFAWISLFFLNALNTF